MKRDRECREEISGTFVANALYIDDQSITLPEGQGVLDKNNAPDNVDEPDNVEMLRTAIKLSGESVTHPHLRHCSWSQVLVAVPRTPPIRRL